MAHIAIARTSNPTYVTYTGDGQGRDGYIVFANGGLNELRQYRGSQPRSGFDNHKGVPKHSPAPRKEATAFDYVPDGSGRDSYIIFNYGLKANYRSKYQEFEKGLRSRQATPLMDARQARRNDPWGTDVSTYNNWPSPQARHRNRKLFDEQRVSIERLSQSPRGSRAQSPRSHSNMSSINKQNLQTLQPKDDALEVDGHVRNQPFFKSRNGSACSSR